MFFASLSIHTVFSDQIDQVQHKIILFFHSGDDIRVFGAINLNVELAEMIFNIFVSVLS